MISAIECGAEAIVLGGVVALGKKKTLESYARDARRIIKFGKVPLFIALTADTGNMFMTLFSTIALPWRHVTYSLNN